MTEKPGDRIGRYRLLQEIGHGGCGVVYMAEQEEPVQRRVALKVIKLGMDTRQVVARFEAERQALALMDHPNIAKVHDAGATDTGRPFFVMELVGGIKITDYCDQNQLTTRQRLDLFIQVCRAIQHAHQKGIIHRDVKPSNVLVATQDGVPVPKVIDFGIAKATQGRLTDQTLFTAFEQFIGTPAYMSPEQAQLGGLDVDTRSDIYSLGVLLYELLTGTTPFDTRELVAAGLDEMRRTIREVEPVKPSTRLTQELSRAQRPLTLSLSPAGGEGVRRTGEGEGHVKALIHQLRGDLDWIVMKCLEKDRARRYDTANGLSRDIERHLNNEPVIARPPSAIYQFQKFLRRNKMMVTSTAVMTTALALGILVLLQNRQIFSVAIIATALVLGILVSTREAIRAKRAERAQEHSRHQAEAARENEARQRELAQAQELIARRRAYASDMIAAWQSFLEGDVARTRDLLERQRPLPGQLSDLRGFEWRYLWGHSRPDELFVLPHSPGPAAVRYSPDGRLLAVASDEGVVSLWDAQTRSRSKFFQAHAADVASIAFSPDGKTLATASRFADQEKVKLWDLEAAEPQAKALPGHRQEAAWVSFSPDGKRLVTVACVPYSKGIPPEIQIWDVASGAQQFELAGHQSWVRQASFSPDGQMLATVDGDGLVKVWDLRTHKEIRSLQGHRGFVNVVTFLPTGELLATADEHGTIILWDWRAGTASSVWPAHRAPIYELAVSRDGKWLATASRDHTAKLLDVQTGEELATFRGHSDRVWSVDFSPDQHSLVTAGSSVRVWRAAPKMDSFIFSPEKSGGTVSFSPDGRFLVQELWRSNQIAVWDPAIRSKVQTSLKGRDSTFSPDGKLLVLICDGRPVVYETTTFLPVSTIAVTSSVSGPVALSPDGRLLAVRRGNREVLIDMATRREVTMIEGTSEDTAPVLFSGDSKELITAASTLFSIRVWDVATWTSRALLRGHTALVEALALSLDGKLLASGGHDRTVRLWDTVAWGPAGVSVVPSNAGAVTRLAFSPDGMTLAIGTYDGVIKLWNVCAQEEVGVLRGHASIIRGLAFRPDGLMLASSSYDGIWRLWIVPSLAVTDAAPNRQQGTPSMQTSA